MCTGNTTDGTKIPVLPGTAFESMESANSLRFLWTALSIESAGLSIENAPFYRMAGFLGISRKRTAFYRKCKFLESAEHIHSVSC